MPDDAPPAFRLENLGHRYNRGQGAREAVALTDVTADIPGGETTVVLGPSGSGKSTLLSLMGLLWDEDQGPEGRLHYGGRDLLRLPADEKAALRAAAFGFVLQSSYLLPHFTNLQNAAMPLAFHGWPAAVRERWSREILEAKEANDGDWSRDLRDKADRFPRAVSLGQRQRYGVLRAVVADPAVVFADEPSSNLDAGNAAATFDLLRRWKAGRLFGEARRRFADDRSNPKAVRDWCRDDGAGRRRTLVVVCHDIHAIRRAGVGDRFLLLNEKHTREACFARAEWNQHADTVERVVGLPAGAAGRDP